MIKVSEPLPGSRTGYKTTHNLSLDDNQIGSIEVGCLTKKDIKTFRRSKRRLRVGKSFGVQVFIETSKGIRANELGKEVLLEIVEALKKNFEGLEEGIYASSSSIRDVEI